MKPTAAVLASFALALTIACSSTPPAPQTGKGMLSVDREPPEGAKVFEQPTWTVGDNFVYRRGGQSRLNFRVIEATEAGFVIEDVQSKMRRRFSPELAELGRFFPKREGFVRLTSPQDFRLKFPLWVGKKWSCHFVDNRPGEQLAIIASYHCDKLETLDTKVGPLECLRIWRTARLESTDKFYDRVSVAWYSPEVGFFARRLEGDQLFELEEFEHQNK